MSFPKQIIITTKQKYTSFKANFILFFELLLAFRNFYCLLFKTLAKIKELLNIVQIDIRQGSMTYKMLVTSTILLRDL